MYDLHLNPIQKRLLYILMTAAKCKRIVLSGHTHYQTFRSDTNTPHVIAVESMSGVFLTLEQRILLTQSGKLETNHKYVYAGEKIPEPFIAIGSKVLKGNDKTYDDIVFFLRGFL